MSNAGRDIPDRLLELLADQALEGLGDAETRELETLLRQHPQVEIDSCFEAVAALDMALVAGDREPMPEALAARLTARADEWIAAEGRSAASKSRPVIKSDRRIEGPRLWWAPWLVAAASLAVASVVWFGRTPSPGAPASIENQFARFVAEPPADFVQVAWGAIGKGIALPDDFTGEVVWSDALNEGYMVFDGLPQNDPTVEQYQLWVFDSTRPEATPVDGGVFDIDASGRVIVPITTKIPVRDAAAFAVTVETPGGVVVSTRDRIATLAAVEKAS